jgi:hypothetical protein
MIHNLPKKEGNSSIETQEDEDDLFPNSNASDFASFLSSFDSKVSLQQQAPVLSPNDVNNNKNNSNRACNESSNPPNANVNQFSPNISPIKENMRNGHQKVHSNADNGQQNGFNQPTRAVVEYEEEQGLFGASEDNQFLKELSSGNGFDSFVNGNGATSPTIAAQQSKSSHYSQQQQHPPVNTNILPSQFGDVNVQRISPSNGMNQTHIFSPPAPFQWQQQHPPQQQAPQQSQFWETSVSPRHWQSITPPALQQQQQQHPYYTPNLAAHYQSVPLHSVSANDWQQQQQQQTPQVFQSRSLPTIATPRMEYATREVQHDMQNQWQEKRNEFRQEAISYDRWQQQQQPWSNQATTEWNTNKHANNNNAYPMPSYQQGAYDQYGAYPSSHMSQQCFQPPPVLPVFRFGFGKTVFIAANSTQVTVYPGLHEVVHYRPEITSSIDFDDKNSRQNYLDFTLNGILRSASREKWELWQIVQLIARHGNDMNNLREQVCQFLLSQCSQERLQSPQVQVVYNEDAIVSLLENGNIREAINEAMNRKMYAIAILLAQGWPELNLQQQVIQTVTSNVTPILGSLLGFNNNMNADWRRTIALILRNECKTKGVNVIQNLGDMLWKDQNNVYSSHLCYLVCNMLTSEKNDVLASRVLLLGGDHKRDVRGFFDKENIERSIFVPEILNSPRFQPFKLIYAYHLATNCANYALAQKYLDSIPKNIPYNQQFRYQHELLSQRLKAILSSSGGGFFRGSVGVTNWLFKSFENLIHGEDASPNTSDSQQQVQRQMQALSEQNHAPPVEKVAPVEATKNTEEITKKDSNENSRSSGGWLNFLVRRRKNEVSLGRSNDYEYCTIRKRWVPKGQAGKMTPEELAEEQKKMAPPDLSAMNFLPSNSTSITQRGSYVDLFNSSGNVQPSMPMVRNYSSPNLTATKPPVGKFFVPTQMAADNSIAHSAPVSPNFKRESLTPPMVPDQNSDSATYIPPPMNAVRHHMRSFSAPYSPMNSNDQSNQ